ncbi:hypothetical protein PHET_07101 [Paragonimus heterotremus]|uniref:Uncharacterized protein n=1 Tax=Paragonimus heterotremus TaxID=100268 RepID=A0A8J4TI06_9TREM|nr:hypothetical protein PHET_07101 [Paragonimus heterotremus]
MMFSICSADLTECPEGLMHIGDGICIIQFANKTTYCEAHRTCDEEGRRRKIRLFMIGRNAGRLPTNITEDVTIHVGAHSLLGGPKGRDAEWQVSEPGYISSSLGKNGKALMSNPPELEQLTLMRYGKMQAVSVDEIATAVVCEKSEKNHPNKVDSSKFRKNHPWTLSSNFMQSEESVGCFRSLPTTTALACGLK